MTVRPLVLAAAERLAEAGVASPEHDAAVLLAHVLGVPRGQLALADPPSPVQVREYQALVGRRATREPLQHLVGVATFRQVDLLVGPGVFVPRPETELLAGWAVERAGALADAPVPPLVVDLCTGSGAIALAVVSEVPGARVAAVEVDEEAFAWAVRNLRGTGVDLRLDDMADALGDLDGTVDIVVANPPYIPLDAYESVTPEVRDHDPALALWSGRDGLDAIRVVERTAARLLTHGGLVGVEHADAQEHSAREVFASTGRWSEVRDHRDLAGRPRYLTARLAR